MAAKRCGSCSKGMRPRGLIPEGNPSYESYFDGKAQEKHTKYRCPACGSIWLNIEESGLGGHGDLWSLLDSN